MRPENVGHVFLIILAAIVAILIVLYNHMSATASIIEQVGGGTSAQPDAAAPANVLGVPLSLAGSPTVGQDGSSFPPPIVPLVVSPGYWLQ